MEHLSMILVSKREQDLLTEQQKSLVRNLFGEHSMQNRSSISAEEVSSLIVTLTDSR